MLSWHHAAAIKAMQNKQNCTIIHPVLNKGQLLVHKSNMEGTFVGRSIHGGKCEQNGSNSMEPKVHIAHTLAIPKTLTNDPDDSKIWPLSAWKSNAL
jgi:hypothetical protein